MKKFFITIKQENKIIENFEKYEIKLDTSKDIVGQAENITAELLDSIEIPQNLKHRISWKIYSGDKNKFMMVSQSRNWQE